MKIKKGWLKKKATYKKYPKSKATIVIKMGSKKWIS